MKWYDWIGMFLLPIFMGFVVARAAMSFSTYGELGLVIVTIVLLITGLGLIFWRDYTVVKHWRNRNVNTK
jgi:hypothetical protein